jgi:hypothetical protein
MMTFASGDGVMRKAGCASLSRPTALRSGLRHTYPLRVEEAALALLAGAGLGLALVDVLQPGLMETVKIINQVV